MRTRLIALFVLCSVCPSCLLILDGPVYRTVPDGGTQADARPDRMRRDVSDASMTDVNAVETSTDDAASESGATDVFVASDGMADVIAVDADATVVPPDAGGPNLEIWFTDDPGQPVVRGLIVEVIPGGLDPPMPSLHLANCVPPIVPAAMVRCLLRDPVPLGANVRFNFFYSESGVFPTGPADMACHTSGGAAPRCPYQASYYRIFYNGVEIVRTADYLLGSLPFPPWGGAIQYLSFIARP